MKWQGKSGHFSVPKIAQKYEGLAWRKLFSAPKIFLKYAAKFSLTLDKSWLGLLSSTYLLADNEKIYFHYPL